MSNIERIGSALTEVVGAHYRVRRLAVLARRRARHHRHVVLGVLVELLDAVGALRARHRVRALPAWRRQRVRDDL